VHFVTTAQLDSPREWCLPWSDSLPWFKFTSLSNFHSFLITIWHSDFLFIRPCSPLSSSAQLSGFSRPSLDFFFNQKRDCSPPPTKIKNACPESGHDPLIHSAPQLSDFLIAILDLNCVCTLLLLSQIKIFSLCFTPPFHFLSRSFRQASPRPTTLWTHP
jgi:hypothetical protein